MCYLKSLHYAPDPFTLTFEEEHSNVSLGSLPPYCSTIVGYGVLPAAVCPGSLEAFTHQAANIATVLLRGTVFLVLL